MPVKNRKFKSQLCHAAGIYLFCLLSFGCGSAPATKNAGAPAADAGAAPATISTRDDALPAIVAFGDSLTAGYGLPEEQSYTRLLQQKLDAEGYRYRVVNAGVSGDTSAGGARRIDWALEGNVKYLILELGGNDGLRGLPVPEMKKNLAAIIERAQTRGVTVILAGIEAPPNLGAEYTAEFRQAFRDLARQYKLPFIPFVLDGIGGRPEMNQPDGIHPNAVGEQALTENVWKTLQPLLAK
ncbi:MAG: arylesterase [Blastocatellia bacterium]|nr:arylesterase [Blastocatellia bacterium]